MDELDIFREALINDYGLPKDLVNDLDDNELEKQFYEQAEEDITDSYF